MNQARSSVSDSIPVLAGKGLGLSYAYLVLGLLALWFSGNALAEFRKKVFPIITRH